MASKKAVTEENLAGLGAERLARLLLDLASEHPLIKRRLRLELAGEAGSEMIAAEITKRIITLRSARSFIDWQKRPAFVRDIDLTRIMIIDRVAQTRPDLALDLMWRFMDLAGSVLNRVDDSNGTVGDVFRTACNDLGTLAMKARPDLKSLAERVFAAVIKNEYGEFDRLIPVIFPALGTIGVATLKAKLKAALPSRTSTQHYDHQAAAVRRALQDIADAEGDVDAYIHLIPAQLRKQPIVGAEAGQRLLSAGRAQEAISILEAAAPKRQPKHGRFDDDLFELGWEGPDSGWEDVYLDALDATGQIERAQQIRWAAFEERLSVKRLRAYLKALPDFEDVSAEDKAMAYAQRFRSFPVALHFFHEWPGPRQAAQLVRTRHAEIDGNMYYLLDPAARWLEGTDPLAATLLRRAMIEDTLNGAKSKRYRHAARHLAECQSLSSLINDYGQFERHDAFLARLRAQHGRKTGFWAQLSESAEAGL